VLQEAQPEHSSGQVQEAEHTLAWQVLLQPVLVFSPDAQTPWPVQEPHTSHWQLPRQERLCLPQLPQLWVWLCPGVQTP